MAHNSLRFSFVLETRRGVGGRSFKSGIGYDWNSLRAVLAQHDRDENLYRVDIWRSEGQDATMIRNREAQWSQDKVV